MKQQDRFTDTGQSLSDMATHFVVHCPKCSGKAVIDPSESSWRLRCTSCFHVEEPGHWYGRMTAYVSVKCRECRHPLTKHAEVDGQWKKLKLKCPECGDEAMYDAQFSRHLMHQGLMTDPVFGLPLWLQTTFGQDLFWAYHYEHLDLLEQYVRAKLRERSIIARGSRNSLMFSRLPSFVRKAGHRAQLLKLIKELQIKVK